MSSFTELIQCFICKEQYKMMISLEQTLNECETLTVAEVLESLHFLTVSDIGRLGRVLCFICVAKVQSCYDFKVKCEQIGKQLETTGTYHGWLTGLTVPPLVPINSITSTTNNEDQLDKSHKVFEVITNDVGPSEIIPNPLLQTLEYSIIKPEIDLQDEKEIIHETFGKLDLNTIAEIKEEMTVENMENILPKTENSPQQSSEIEAPEIKTEFTIVTPNEPLRKKLATKTFTCPICQRNFTCKRLLRMHSLVHSGQKPYVCHVCNKSFTQSYNLTRHKMTHTGEKPHVCDICNKLFTHTGSLKRHKMIHTGEKPHVCDVCNKSFIESCGLRKHKLSHTRKKL